MAIRVVRKASSALADALPNCLSQLDPAALLTPTPCSAQVPLYRLYNDGNNATGNKEEMFLDERMSLAVDGIVIASVEVIRPPMTELRADGGGEEDGEVRVLVGFASAVATPTGTDGR